MDEVVRQAMAKWPDVPHCFGWLRLDARGAWRMRDDHAQQADLPGERISHPALLAFINRNYQHDAQGRWYFQNGPQRVFVDLELTPFIAHTAGTCANGEPALVLQTGQALSAVAQALLDADGRLYLRCAGGVCAIDDRDMAQLLPALQIAGRRDDEALLRWIEGERQQRLIITLEGRPIDVEFIEARQLAHRFGFVVRPR